MAEFERFRRNLTLVERCVQTHRVRARIFKEIQNNLRTQSRHDDRAIMKSPIEFCAFRVGIMPISRSARARHGCVHDQRFLPMLDPAGIHHQIHVLYYRRSGPTGPYRISHGTTPSLIEQLPMADLLEELRNRLGMQHGHKQ
jgi:hypothetical protein